MDSKERQDADPRTKKNSKDDEPTKMKKLSGQSSKGASDNDLKENEPIPLDSRTGVSNFELEEEIPGDIYEYYDEDSDEEGNNIWGDDDEEELNSARPRPKRNFRVKLRAVSTKIKLPLWVRFLGKVSLAWEAILCALLLWLSLLVVFNAIFSFQDEQFHLIINILDIIFGVDVVLRLIVEVWRRQTKAQFLIFAVQYTYLQAMLDFLSILPVDRLYLFIAGTDNLVDLEILDLLRLNRLLRTFRAKRFFDTLNLTLKLNEQLIFFMKFIYLYMVYIHFFVLILALPCGITFLDWRLYRAREVVDAEPYSCFWTHRLDKAVFIKEEAKGEPPKAIQLYAYALEFVVVTLTTLGLGDIFPVGALEVGVMIVVMTLGSVWLGGELSSGLIDFQIEHDSARFDLFYRLECIHFIYSRVRCPPNFLNKVQEYYEFLWNYREGIHDADLSRLPESLQQEIMLDICSEMFFKASFFRNLEEAFLRSLAKTVKINMYNPDMILCKAGAPSLYMYYVVQGELAMSARCNENHTAAILKPGCIIGEMNILFSFPYETQIHTITGCQLLVLAKADLLDALERYPFSMEILKHRFTTRRQDLYDSYRLVGVKPVNYTVRISKNKTEQDLERPVVIRSSKGFNPIQKKDIVDDSKATYLLSMPCTDKNHAKDPTISYSTCQIIPIFTIKIGLLRAYNKFVLLYIGILNIVVPYCAAFAREDEDDNSHCIQLLNFQIVYYVYNVVDLTMEILFACPTSGIYYKFYDGIKIKRRLPTFWFDVYACIPFGLLLQPPWHWFALVTQTAFKFFKITRYISYCDNTQPFNLLLLRLVKFFILIAYGTHFTSCFLFWITTGTSSSEDTWLDSYYFATGRIDNLRGVALKERNPYLYPFFFATSIITTVGHGGFHPQTVSEMFCLMAIGAIALALVAYCSAGLTSALHCTVRPELNFNQKLLGIRSFLEHLGVGERLYWRIVEHYTLQNQLTQGVTLAEGESNLLYDAPVYLGDDAIFYVTEIYLEGVPLFSKVSDDIIKMIASHMRTYLLPPNMTFVQKGEVRRQLYIIARGSVGMYAEPVEGEIEEGAPPPDEPFITLTSTGHFGIRDLLFAEPCQYKIETLSYVQLFAIDYLTFRDCFSHEVVLNTIINAELNNLNAEVTDIAPALHLRESKDKVKPISSWVRFPRKEEEKMPHSTYHEFEDPYKALLFPRLIRTILLRRTLHPVGTWIKSWVVFVSIVAFLNLLTLFIETFMGHRAPPLRVFQLILDILTWSDIYVKLHCAYYTNANILITHPLKTSTHYVYEGMFFYDICFTVPFELTLWVFGFTNFMGYGVGATWYSKLRWGRALQIYKCRQTFVVFHHNFDNRIPLLGALYVFLTIGVSALTGAIASYVGCPILPGIWQEGDEYKLPLCPIESWARSNDEFEVNENFLNRFALSLYFAVQSVVLIGFGDLIQPNESELLFLSITVVLGCFLIQFITADLTAAQVDSNATRAVFEERRRVVLAIFEREQLPIKWITPIGEHLNNTWNQSRGLQPAQLFRELHPALESELFREIVGDKLTKILIFEDMHETVIRSLCELIRKQYFLRGERITRLGNLEYEMFIIVEGSVFMTNRNLEWQVTLNEGEYFGEIGMLYGMARKYTAIAASNVQAFMLNSDDFAVLLDRYPSLREKIIQLMKYDRKESYERKIQKLNDMACLDKSVRDMKELHTKEIREHFRSRGLDAGLFELEASKGEELSRWKKFKNYAIGYGSRDRDLPFLYFATNASKSKTWKSFKFLIHPECTYIKFHYKCVMAACYLSPAFALYDVIFVDVNNSGQTVTKLVNYFGMFLELIMWWTIFLRFITPFEVPGGFYCKSYLKIALHYITNPALFLVDFITAFPYEYAFGNDFASISLVKFLRLIHFYRVIGRGRENLEISIFRFRLSISGSFLLLCAHINACMFYSLACDLTTRVCSSNSWVQVYRENYLNYAGAKKSISQTDIETLNLPSQWYFRSLYWVVTIFTTIGYGDIIPNNVGEYGLAIVSMVFGFFGLTIIVGNISTGLASLGRARRQYFYSIRTLVNHLSAVGLSELRQEIMKTYYLFLWQSGRGTSYHTAFSILPLSARFDASYLTFGAVLQCCKFFGGIHDICFYRNVSVRLYHAVFIPGNYIATQDEYGKNLFIIFKGRVGAYRRNEMTTELEYRKCYGIGDYFGRIPALFHDASYNKVYRAERLTEVLIFPQNEIIKLSKYYPRWRNFLVRMVHRKYSYLLEDMEHIFENEMPPEEEDVPDSAEEVEITFEDPYATMESENETVTESLMELAIEDDGQVEGIESDSEEEETKQWIDSEDIKEENA